MNQLKKEVVIICPLSYCTEQFLFINLFINIHRCAQQKRYVNERIFIRFTWSYVLQVLLRRNYKNVEFVYRSLSSAACDASANLAVAVARRSSDLSRSSSNNWIRRFRAATSDSAYKKRKKYFQVKELFFKYNLIFEIHISLSFFCFYFGKQIKNIYCYSYIF